MTRFSPLFAFLFALCAASFLAAASLGNVKIAWDPLWSALLYKEPGLYGTVIWELRIPRATTAFVSGGMLGLSGALMQVLLRNPLADPYILSGISVIVLYSIMWFNENGHQVERNIHLVRKTSIVEPISVIWHGDQQKRLFARMGR